MVGRAADEVRAAVSPETGAGFVEQKERLGTGHAVLQARVACGDGPGTLLVLPGDVPLLSDATLKRLVDHHVQTGAAATLLTALVPDATGYGRVVREQDRPVGIVEHRDATPAQRQIREIGTSVYCFDAARFWPALAQVTPENEQSEYYLTDVIGDPASPGAAARGGDRRGSERVPRGQRPQAARGAGRHHAAAHPRPAHGRAG